MVTKVKQFDIVHVSSDREKQASINAVMLTQFNKTVKTGKFKGTLKGQYEVEPRELKLTILSVVQDVESMNLTVRYSIEYKGRLKKSETEALKMVPTNIFNSFFKLGYLNITRRSKDGNTVYVKVI